MFVVHQSNTAAKFSSVEMALCLISTEMEMDKHHLYSLRLSVCCSARLHLHLLYFSHLSASPLSMSYDLLPSSSALTPPLPSSVSHSTRYDIHSFRTSTFRSTSRSDQIRSGQVRSHPHPDPDLICIGMNALNSGGFVPASFYFFPFSCR